MGVNLVEERRQMPGHYICSWCKSKVDPLPSGACPSCGRIPYYHVPEGEHWDPSDNIGCLTFPLQIVMWGVLIWIARLIAAHQESLYLMPFLFLMGIILLIGLSTIRGRINKMGGWRYPLGFKVRILWWPVLYSLVAIYLGIGVLV